MNGQRLKEIAIELWGERGWEKSLAAFLKVDVSSIRRWVTREKEIPGPVEAAINLHLSSRKR
jgi:hypothetical protein